MNNLEARTLSKYEFYALIDAGLKKHNKKQLTPVPYIYKVRNRFTDQIGYVTHLTDEVWCNVVWEDGSTESYKHLSKMEVIEE